MSNIKSFVFQKMKQIKRRERKIKKHQVTKKAPSEKESMQELAKDLARADDDGFALPEKIRGIL